jgi:hypothetical protein
MEAVCFTVSITGLSRPNIEDENDDDDDADHTVISQNLSICFHSTVRSDDMFYLAWLQNTIQLL